MDEKLAKGFSKQFLSWFMDDYLKKTDKAFNEFETLNKRNCLQDKNSFKKWALKRQKILEDFNIGFLLGGSSNQPFLLEQGYLILKEDDVNLRPRAFDEYHLYSTVSLFSFSERYLSDSEIEERKILLEDANYIISQHAIQRIYQRTDYFDSEKAINHYAIIKELKYVPVWSSYWFTLNKKKAGDINNVIIPAPKGIFFGQFLKKPYEDSIVLHINTFYGLNQLSDIQKNIREELLIIQKGFESSYLSFITAKVAMFHRYILDAAAADFAIMNYRFNKSFKAKKTSEKLNEMDMHSGYLDDIYSKAIIKKLYEFDQKFKEKGDYKKFIKSWLIDLKNANLRMKSKTKAT